ncbi:hypothetical protein K7432_016810 [Basidiobolus ranarum]|uniref:Uncharacterized protein n=1 Tax=Basidiobolus ranarum TaxID=34480 RepID=A0ABR2WE77_9FUNG
MPETPIWQSVLEKIVTQQSQLTQILSQPQYRIAKANKNLPGPNISANTLSIKIDQHHEEAFEARGAQDAPNLHHAAAYLINAAIQWYHNRATAASTGKLSLFTTWEQFIVEIQDAFELQHQLKQLERKSAQLKQA